MRVKRIEIKDGYKRFHHLTIDLGEAPARIIALVGPNGCGKSSVLDAMLFKYSNQRRQIGDRGARGNDYHSMTGGPYDTQKSIIVQFDKGSFDKVVEMKSQLNPELQNTLFSFRSCYRYNSSVKLTETRIVGDIGQNSFGASFTADLDAKMEDNYRRLLAAFNRYTRENRQTSFDAATKYIIGEINASLCKCLDLQVDDIGSVDENRGTLYFKKTDHPKPFEFNFLSAGEKEAVDLILDLYLRKRDFTDTIFLIDEPELHINTATQRKLLNEINHLVGSDCQIWIATHSIGFMRALQEDLKDQCQVIHFKQDARYASEDITLRPIRPTTATWREIFATALDDLTGLLSPRQIIYCEGRDMPGGGKRERGLDARVFNQIFGPEHPQTLFTSSGGDKEPEQRMSIALKVLSKALTDVEFVVLNDRDRNSGKPVSEEHRQAMLKDAPKWLRILRRWEIENYLFDFEVLTAFCHKHERIIDRECYDKVIGNIVDDDVKSAERDIVKLCGLSENTGSEKFKLQLAEVITPETAVYKELSDCIFKRL